MAKTIAYDIVLIEDDPFLYKVLSERLKKEGMNIKVATDGEMALQVLAEVTPKLILLDLILPKKSGFEILAELRKKPRWKKIPVLILSNLGHQEDIQHMEKFGVSGYLVKADYSLSEIVQKVQEHLKSA